MMRLHFSLAVWLFLTAAGGLSAQVEVRSARLELIEIERQYRDETNLDSTRGTVFGRLDFTVEFDSIGQNVSRVDLVTPAQTFEDVDREGSNYVVREYVGAISAIYLGSYEIRVTTSKGAPQSFPFQVDRLSFDRFPTVEFPIDGLDRVDPERPRIEWDDFGDDDRVDLFEIDANARGAPPDFSRNLGTWRDSSESLDLEFDLFDERRYELWVGSTEIEELFDPGFPIEIRFTSARYLRFTTGPDSRDRVTGFNSHEAISSARAGIERKRFGVASTDSEEVTLATLEGGSLDEAEVARIRGERDGEIVGSFEKMDTIANSVLFRKEIVADAGDTVLFLFEFRPTNLVGSEIAVVDSRLAFPEVSAPSPNQGGLGADVEVAWSYSDSAESFEVTLTDTESLSEMTSGSLAGNVRAHPFTGVAANRDYLLQVAAVSDEGSRSVLCYPVSSRPAGDWNADGGVSGADAFGFAAAWRRSTLEGSDASNVAPVFRLDSDGDEWLGPRDVLAFLEASVREVKTSR